MKYANKSILMQGFSHSQLIINTLNRSFSLSSNARNILILPSVVCVLVAAIIVKEEEEDKNTRSVFNQMELIFHQILGIPSH